LGVTLKRKAPLILSLLIFILSISEASAQPIRIVASIYPVGDMVKEIGGDRVDVRVLLPPGATPHVFEPTASAVRELSQARIFFEIGAGLEFWADRLIQAAGSRMMVVVLSRGIRLLHSQGDHVHLGETGNPHIWLDPILAVEMAKKIEQSLEEADPQGSVLYRKKSAVYIAKLEALDAEIRKTVSTFSIKSFVSFHPAWDYFAIRYGLKSVGVIEESPGKEPSPRRLEAIIDAIKKYHIKAVFAEPQLNSRAAEIIAREAGVKVVMLDPQGGLPGRETYLSLMKYNLEQMSKAMR
jgi:ABC-type Zn uptake system ZnuABC Zn-binding protein ZnuA